MLYLNAVFKSMSINFNFRYFLQYWVLLYLNAYIIMQNILYILIFWVIRATVTNTSNGLWNATCKNENEEYAHWHICNVNILVYFKRYYNRMHYIQLLQWMTKLRFYVTNINIMTLWHQIFELRRHKKIFRNSFLCYHNFDPMALGKFIKPKKLF